MRIASRVDVISTETAFEAAARARALEATGRSVIHLDAAALARMKPGTILVNTTRGPVVDPTALFEALRDGVIRAAALDVTDPEPIPADDPLLTLENCLIVPHIGSATEATRGKMASMAAANLVAGLRRERLPTPVKPGVFGPD